MRRLSKLATLLPGANVGRFLLTKPRWPDSVTRPVVSTGLGADYDTTWARTKPARLARFALIEGISRPLVRTIASPQVIGLDRLDSLEGPVIFAANHSSHLDTSLVLTCLPSRFRHHSVVAAGADYFFDKKAKAALWALWINIIPIERERVGRRSAALSADLLNSGWNLVIFPEGTRSRDGFVADFRGGAAYLGIKCDVPVVPIHLEGARAVFGVGRRSITPGPTRVTIGEPLVAEPGEKSRDFNERIQRGVDVAADEGRTDWWSAKQRSARNETPSLKGPEGVTGWRRSWAGTTKLARRNPNRWP